MASAADLGKKVVVQNGISVDATTVKTSYVDMTVPEDGHFAVTLLGCDKLTWASHNTEYRSADSYVFQNNNSPTTVETYTVATQYGLAIVINLNTVPKVKNKKGQQKADTTTISPLLTVKTAACVYDGARIQLSSATFPYAA